MYYINGAVQERCESGVLAIELCLSCINPLICCCYYSIIGQEIYNRKDNSPSYNETELYTQIFYSSGAFF